MVAIVNFLDFCPTEDLRGGGVNNVDVESISWKKAKSQITVTEDIFPENKRFLSEPNQGQSLLYCATYHIIDSLLLDGLSSTLRLVFCWYKLNSECLTTTIQKRNYNRASEIHQCEWTKLCCFVSGREEEKN